MAFHPYPQLIRALFNAPRCGPPSGITRTSSWPWIDHSVSGLPRATRRPLRTRFRCGYVWIDLTLQHRSNSQAHYAKGTPSPPKGIRPLVDIRFQVLFHSPPGVLFTFPSRYYFAIGCKRVFSLIPWSGQIRTKFLVFRATRDSYPGSLPNFVYGAITLSGIPFQVISTIRKISDSPCRPQPAPVTSQQPPPCNTCGF